MTAPPTAWAHLPNAALIDEVLASVRAHPGKWSAAWYAVRGTAQAVARGTAWATAWATAWDAARDAVWNAAWGAARDAAWYTAWSAASDAARDAAWGAARDVIAALIAYDGAGQFMKVPVEHLQRLYRIDPHPMYLLLQPAAVVFAED